MEPKKYIKMLISMPTSTYQNFTQTIPNGQRSQYLVKLIDANLKPKNSKKIPKSFWSEISKHVKGDYSHEDPVKLAKDAWNYVD